MEKIPWKKRHSLYLIIFLFIGMNAVSQDANIIPYPQILTHQSGQFKLSSSTQILYDSKCRNEAVYLQQILKDEQHLNVPASSKGSKALPPGSIYLKLTYANATVENKEGYTLQVNPKSILISAAHPAGVFYAIQSLRQLIKNKSIASISITDKPTFQWRGFLLDEGRYFKGENVVKDILDEMALLKMNTFHWHLTDDQGWRIEIKKYPRLTEIGSKRKQSETGTWNTNIMDGKPHEGYYTQAQIKDIIAYASARHITIIPELEMPGHASAAIASYPWLGTENKVIEVPTHFGIKYEVYNVVNPKVKTFLHDVLDEVMALFPSEIIHIGGDEVKYDQWKASKEVADYMKQHNIKTPADLQIDFTNSISSYLEKNKHRMIGWNEILGGHHKDSADHQVENKLSPTAIIDFWSGDPNIVTQAAKKGHDVVNAYWWFTYLDYDYAHTSLKRSYSFNPIPDSMPKELHHKVLGLNTQMWGEWIPTVERMNYLIYPRIAAMAEIGWTDPGQKNYDRFFTALQGYFKNHWNRKGIQLLPEQLYESKK